MLNFTIPRRVFLAYCYSAFRFACHVSMSHDISKLLFSIDCGIRDCVSPLSSWILTQHVIVCGHPLTVSSLLAARAHKALLLALIWFLLLSVIMTGIQQKHYFLLLSGSGSYRVVVTGIQHDPLWRFHSAALSFFVIITRQYSILGVGGVPYSIRFEFVMISYHRSDSTLHKCVAQRATWSYPALSFMTSSCA